MNKKLITIASLALLTSATYVEADQRASIKAQAMYASQYAPIADIVRLGTHNSYNSSAYQNGYVRYIDPQQIHTIGEQLNMGARFIELDIHWKLNSSNSRYDYLLCHGGFCSGTDRYLTEGLTDINTWLDANPDEVVILYVEDHSGSASTKLYDRFSSTGIANKIYPSGGCKPIPGDLTNADVLGAGKQVILWKDGRDGSPACYEGADQRFSNISHTSLGGLTRVWEDATVIGELFDNAADSRIDAADVTNFVSQGINIINLDDMSATDGRNERILWSWNPGEPNNANNEDCAMQMGSNGRWSDVSCSLSAAYACQNIVSGEWALGARQGVWDIGASVCAELGDDYRFSAPVNPATNDSLKALAAGENVWIALNDQGVEGDWAMPSFDYRHLQDKRSNLCMVIANGAVAGNPLTTGSCSSKFNNDKWLHEQATGLLRSQQGSLCASTDSQTVEGAELVARTCDEHDASQKFVLKGHSIRLASNPNLAVATFSAGAEAKVGLVSATTADNLQWKFGGRGEGVGVDIPTAPLQYILATGAQRKWADSGSGANLDGSIWRLNTPLGFYPLGDIPMSGYGFSSDIEKILVKGDQPGVARPTGYQWIWNDSGTGADADVTIWRPIAPEGYVCLGDVMTGNHGAAPSTDLIRCVGEYYLEQADGSQMKWNDLGTGGDHDVSWWYAYSNDGSAMNAGSLRAVRHYSTPASDLMKQITRSKTELVDPSVTPQVGTGWTALSCCIKQAEVAADGTIWGTSHDDRIWQWDGTRWNQIPGGLRQVAVGGVEYVWGVNGAGNIYRYNATSGWVRIPGGLSNISVGSDGTVWGVNSSGNIYRFNGSSWTQIPGGLRQVSVGSADHVIGINGNNTLFKRVNETWSIIGQGFQNASIADDGTIWATKPDRSVHVSADSGVSWTQVSGSLVNISAGSNSQVIGVGIDGKTPYIRNF